MLPQARATCASTPPRPPPRRPGSAPASAAGPTPAPARPSGTPAADLVGPGHALHRRRRGRPRRRGRAGRPARVRRAPDPAAAARRGRRRARSPSPAPSGPRPARVLIETTDLPFADVAFARRLLQRPPVQRHRARGVRDARPTRAARPRAGGATGGRAAGAGAHHAAAAVPRSRSTPKACSVTWPPPRVPGVEEYVVGTATYRRTLRLPHGPAIVELTPQPDHVRCRLRLADLRDLTAGGRPLPAAARPRRRPRRRRRALAHDAALAPLVAKAPGRRVPRTVDGAELALRAVLGQQVSTAARPHATRPAWSRVAATPLADPTGGLTALLPRAVAACADGRPGRAGAARAPRRAAAPLAPPSLARRPVDLDAGADRDDGPRRALALPGIGPWTAATIAMRRPRRSRRLPSPATSASCAPAARVLGLAHRDALARAERWRPWRSYAIQYLWAATDHPMPSTGCPEEHHAPADRDHPSTARSAPLTLVADDDAVSHVRTSIAPFTADRDRAAGRAAFAEAAASSTVLRRRAHDFDLPLAPGGTAFQQAVWRRCARSLTARRQLRRDRPRGRAAHRPSRAVGAANGRNPIAIVVPCHRVIGADGSLTGYGGGIGRKQWLLAHEGTRLTA